MSEPSSTSAAAYSYTADSEELQRFPVLQRLLRGELNDKLPPSSVAKVLDVLALAPSIAEGRGREHLLRYVSVQVHNECSLISTRQQAAELGAQLKSSKPAVHAMREFIALVQAQGSCMRSRLKAVRQELEAEGSPTGRFWWLEHECAVDAAGMQAAIGRLLAQLGDGGEEPGPSAEDLVEA